MWNENVILTHLHVGGSAPSFSPDGTKIVYHSTDGGGDGDVWVMDIDGSNRTQLTFDKDGGMTPSYSPDGKTIVYERWEGDGEGDLWVMNSDGSNQKKLCDDSWYPDSPSFMPDGKILFEAARQSPHSDTIGAPAIWMMDANGSNKTLLAPALISSVGSTRPTINRDGTKIAFEHGSGDSFSIYLVEDLDDNGIWEDSDGDHVADICDGYPYDPDRGYLTNDDNEGSLPGFETGVTVSVLVAVPVLWWKKRGIE